MCKTGMSHVLNALGDLAPFICHTEFTKVQEQVIPLLMEGNDNAVIAAPTGSGKTLLLEVAMLRLFRPRLLSAATTNVGAARALGGFSSGSPSSLGCAKAVYICPIKALASEKYTRWRETFAPLVVVLETGDQDLSRSPEEALAEVSAADLILTTPERWDSITRRWREAAVLGLVHAVGLLLLDEVHTVHEDRGAALEAVVSRMKTIKAATRQQTGVSGEPLRVGGGGAASARFVATSGTLPNIGDFAEWLQAPPHMVFSFTNEDRPVPLHLKVIGFTSDTNNPFAFDRFLSFKLFGLVRQYGDGRPSMVFCASRKETVSSAQRIVQDIRELAKHEGREQCLRPSADAQEMCNRASDRQLRECLAMGIAYHHAALSFQDRQLVERMFKDQYISVLCTTTTLALGVNLPAHLVVIKGTTFFKNGKREDVPLSEVAQMCGRAGRPGMDDCGVALILTTEDKVNTYESLRHGDAYTTVESQLHLHMVEHVNAEIALRTIHSFASGLSWVRTTFFWIRLRKCPRHYGLRFATKEDENAFSPELFVESLMERVIQALHEEGCIELRSGGRIQQATAIVAARALSDSGCAASGGPRPQASTAPPSSLCPPTPVVGTFDRNAVVGSCRLGRSMARLYILFATVQTFSEEMRSRQSASGTSQGPPVSGDCSIKEGANDAHDKETASSSVTKSFKTRFQLPDVLRLVSRSEEFAEIRLRQGDRGPLNDLNKRVKFPLSSGKRGGREVREDWHKTYVLIQAQIAQLPSTDVSLRNDCVRLWSLVPRIARFTCDYAWATGSFSFAVQANLLMRCIEQRVWPDGLLLRQLDGVNEAVASALARSGYQSFESISEIEPRKLEAICGRLPPYGAHLQAAVREIPACELTVRREQPPSGSGGGACTTRAPTRDRYFSISVSAKTSSAAAIPTTGHSSSAGGLPGWKKNRIETFLLVVGSVASDRILLQRVLPVHSIFAAPEPAKPRANCNASPRASPPVSFQFVVPADLLVPPPSLLAVNLIPGHWVGREVGFVLDAAAAAMGEVFRSSALPSEGALATGATRLTMEAFCRRPKTAGLPPGTSPSERASSAAGEGLAATAAVARASFAGLLRDLEYIHGGSPSKEPRERREGTGMSKKRRKGEGTGGRGGGGGRSPTSGTSQEVPLGTADGRQSVGWVEPAAAPLAPSPHEAAAPSASSPAMVEQGCLTEAPGRIASVSYLPFDQCASTVTEASQGGSEEDSEQQAGGRCRFGGRGTRHVHLRSCESPEPYQRPTHVSGIVGGTRIAYPGNGAAVNADGGWRGGWAPPSRAPPPSLPPFTWRPLPAPPTWPPTALADAAYEKRARLASAEQSEPQRRRQRFSFGVQCAPLPPPFFAPRPPSNGAPYGNPSPPELFSPAPTGVAFSDSRRGHAQGPRQPAYWAPYPPPCPLALGGGWAGAGCFYAPPAVVDPRQWQAYAQSTAPAMRFGGGDPHQGMGGEVRQSWW